jgi:hypothetical protein
MIQKTQVFYPYRLVASYADGSRLLFDGATEDEAMEKLEAAQADHGDITWYDGVTDLHYENGKYYELCPHEEIVILVPDRPDDKMS